MKKIFATVIIRALFAPVKTPLKLHAVRTMMHVCIRLSISIVSAKAKQEVKHKTNMVNEILGCSSPVLRGIKGTLILRVQLGKACLCN